MVEIITTCIQIIFVKKLTSTFGNVHRVDLEEFSKVGNHLRCSEYCHSRVTTVTSITGVSLHILLRSWLGGWRVKYDSVQKFILSINPGAPIASPHDQTIHNSKFPPNYVPRITQRSSCCCCGEHQISFMTISTLSTQHGAGDTAALRCCHSADNMKHLEICSACSCCGRVRNCEQLQQQNLYTFVACQNGYGGTVRAISIIHQLICSFIYLLHTMPHIHMGIFKTSTTICT